MATAQPGPVTPRVADPFAAGRALVDLAQNFSAAQRAVAAQLSGSCASPADPLPTLRAMGALNLALWSDPARLFREQAAAWMTAADLMTHASRRAMGLAAEPVATAQRGDRRFSAKDWESPAFDMIRQAYLASAERLEALVDGAEMDADAKVRAGFVVRQLIAALSPANFPATNPTVMRKTVETGGLNLVEGASNLFADMASGEGLVRRRSAEDFELGRSIAATPGAVVWQNDLMQLIQYAPSTPTVVRRPVLLVPPMVNKYYLFDLQPRTSFLKWLVDQGQTVFVVSWANPDERLRDKDLTAFVKEGVVESLRAIEQATGERAVDVIGFCLGGTLVSITLGYLQAIGEADRAASATLIAALTDFSEMGEWSAFLGERDVEAFARHLADKGYIAAHDLQKLFSAVRANDLVWGPFVAHYLLAEQAPASDLLWWFNDGARMPEALLNTYLRQVVRDNGLRTPGAVKIDGQPIDLAAVKTPVRFVSMKDDHVAGWAATYAGARMFGGPVEFILGGSGHNAGVINPPSANKHGYWTNTEVPADADAWLASATRHEGSWWTEWRARVALGQEQVPARTPGDGALEPLEAAPGSYVRVRH